MRYKQFDVVLLKNNRKATILGIEEGKYKAEIVDEIGNRIEIRMIDDEEIECAIVKK